MLMCQKNKPILCCTLVASQSVVAVITKHFSPLSTLQRSNLPAILTGVTQNSSTFLSLCVVTDKPLAVGVRLIGRFSPFDLTDILFCVSHFLVCLVRNVHVPSDLFWHSFCTLYLSLARFCLCARGIHIESMGLTVFHGPQVVFLWIGIVRTIVPRILLFGTCPKLGSSLMRCCCKHLLLIPRMMWLCGT